MQKQEKSILKPHGEKGISKVVCAIISRGKQIKVMQFSEFQKKVYSATRQIPFGTVVTYAEIACVIGKPQAVRAVGNALNKNSFRNIPCHRVIRSDGRVGGYNKGRQKKILLLTREGASITNGCINSWKKNPFLK